jgi:type III pantothenate kinase
MLLAIDVGNTHSVFGIHDGTRWVAVWRKQTDARSTEDEIAVWISQMMEVSRIAGPVRHAICASVVPQGDAAIRRLCDKHLRVPLRFLTSASAVGLEIDYDPPTAVGADRIANALGALARFQPPVVVVDFGTATTFDAISREGRYVGGAILPGVLVSTEALVSRAAKLPQIDFRAPSTAIGKDTIHSLQSGIVLGYAGAIDTLASRIDEELGGGSVIVATGGLGGLFVDVCARISEYVPDLTLDGLRIASEALNASRVS